MSARLQRLDLEDAQVDVVDVLGEQLGRHDRGHARAVGAVDVDDVSGVDLHRVGRFACVAAVWTPELVAEGHDTQGSPARRGTAGDGVG